VSESADVIAHDQEKRGGAASQLVEAQMIAFALVSNNGPHLQQVMKYAVRAGSIIQEYKER